MQIGVKFQQHTYGHKIIFKLLNYDYQYLILKNIVFIFSSFILIQTIDGQILYQQLRSQINIFFYYTHFE